MNWKGKEFKNYMELFEYALTLTGEERVELIEAFVLEQPPNNVIKLHPRLVKEKH